MLVVFTSSHLTPPRTDYYACNVGYSIGFGSLVEHNNASRLSSVFTICLGAGAVGGGLGYFVSANLESSDDFAAEVPV